MKKPKRKAQKPKNITIRIKRGGTRPTWEEVWFAVTDVIRRRSVCLYYKVGAVIIRDSQLLALGYNGPPRGIEHCDKVGCAKIVGGKMTKHQGLCRGAHAEINAIANAASLGINIGGSDMYITYRPCAMCAKTILNSGVKRIFYLHDYDGDEVVWDYFKQGKVIIKKIEFQV